jgi:hypothetical protein
VEIVEPADNTKHRWLGWLGLQEPPPEPDSWVMVARGFGIDELKKDSSAIASRLVDLLSGAGIQAHQRSYEFDTTRVTGGLSGATGGMVKRVAVLVHNRDRLQASEVAAEFEHELERERLEQGRELASATFNDELARDALEARPLPEV